MLSLYRRHRPRSFDEVVGQESVVRTLRNAIELGKVHHAYLFVGSRGTGKTSMAKLLACALNAPGGPSADFSPDEAGCRAIMTGSSLDVVEMDAASNNSVDDIRELRENVALTPMGGARRVYILDEAHMLSTQAWNAFLKTLEEPPAHVVFVLATTEAHKIPATIVDRCHRFDFQRPSLEQVAGVVRRVADAESISVPDAAVGMIARKAAGSFRDALGTLEQLVTYGGTEIALDDVLDALGVADARLILDTTEALVECDPRAALLAVGQLADSGRDYDQFVRDLAGHLRHLLVVQTLGDVPDSFAVTASHTDRLASQAERLAQGDLLRAIDLLAAATAAVKDGSEPRLQLEVALLKATQPRADQSLQALMRRIDTLEARLEAGGAGAAAAPSAVAPVAPVAPSAAASGSGPTAVAPEAEPPAGSAPDRAGAAAPVGGERAPAMAAASDRGGSPASESGERAPAMAAASNRGGPEASASGERAPAVAAASDRGGSTASAPVRAADERQHAVAGAGGGAAVVVAVAEVPAEAEPAEAGGAAAPPDLERIQALWSGVADAVREENGMVAALIADAMPAALDGRRLTVAFPADAAFSKRKAEANRELVLGALRSLTGTALTVVFELGEADGDGPVVTARTLGQEELLARLRSDFAAEEVFADADADAAPAEPTAEPAEAIAEPDSSPDTEDR